MKLVKLWFSGASTKDHRVCNYGENHNANIYLYKRYFKRNMFHRNDYETCYKFTKKQFHEYFEYDKKNHRWQLKQKYMNKWLYELSSSYEIFNLNNCL